MHALRYSYLTLLLLIVTPREGLSHDIARNPVLLESRGQCVLLFELGHYVQDAVSGDPFRHDLTVMVAIDLEMDRISWARLADCQLNTCSIFSHNRSVVLLDPVGTKTWIAIHAKSGVAVQEYNSRSFMNLEAAIAFQDSWKRLVPSAGSIERFQYGTPDALQAKLSQLKMTFRDSEETQGPGWISLVIEKSGKELTLTTEMLIQEASGSVEFSTE